MTVVLVVGQKVPQHIMQAITEALEVQDTFDLTSLTATDNALPVTPIYLVISSDTDSDLLEKLEYNLLKHSNMITTQ
jgi:hypothetical protein